MARNSSPAITSLAQFLLSGNGREFELPLRGAAENSATNSGVDTTTGNSATDSSPAASPGSASSSGSPTNAKSEAEEEADIRCQAIRYMAKFMGDKPKGSSIAPPPWYRRDEERFSIARNRPRSWVKNWKTGKIRPRTMMDGFKQHGRLEVKAKTRKAPVGVGSGTTINRGRFHRVKRLCFVPFPRNCIMSLLTLNPNKIISVETKIDSGYDADMESDSN